MQNSSPSTISRATESLTLYLKWTHISWDPIYHDILQDYYWRAFGVNLDLCPEEVIKHCEWLKQDLECLYYHCRMPDWSDEEHIMMLDQIIERLKQEA